MRRLGRTATWEVTMDTEPLVFVGIDWAELPKVPTA
jgi:hypothetical protein